MTSWILNENLSVGLAPSSVNFNGSQGAILLGSVDSPSAAPPVSGIYLYAESGSLYYWEHAAGAPTEINASGQLGPTGSQGPTGSGGGGGTGSVPPGLNYGDYLYWDGSQYVSGDSYVNIGASAASGVYSVNIGDSAGNNQGLGSIALGASAGINNSFLSISVGNNSQAWGTGSVCLGANTKCGGTGAISIGYNQLGQNALGNASISVGLNSCGGGVTIPPSNNVIAIGQNAAYTEPGNFSINIGTNSGVANPNSSANYTIINASGNEVDAQTSSALYINPIRAINDAGANYSLYYNSSTSELTAGPKASSSITTGEGISILTTSVNIGSLSTSTQGIKTLTVTSPSTAGNYNLYLNFSVSAVNFSTSADVVFTVLTTAGFGPSDRISNPVGSSAFLASGFGPVLAFTGNSPTSIAVIAPSTNVTMTLSCYATAGTTQSFTVNNGNQASDNNYYCTTYLSAYFLPV